MAKTKLFCCGNQGACSNYRKTGLVDFRHVKAKTGYYPEKKKNTGIYWIFLMSGKLLVHTKKQDMEMEGGEMFLIPSRQYWIEALTDVEYILFISDRPTEYCIRTIRQLVVEEKKEELTVISLPLQDIIQKFLNLLVIYLKSGINCSVLFEEKQEELFILMNTYYLKPELAAFFYSLKFHKDVDLRKMIEENCSRAKNVQELAQLCGHSVNGFKKAFKEIYNEPVYQWMLHQKTLRLKQRLTEEKVNLKMIISEFGFSSPAHFTKFCKQWLGMVPTKYIEEIRARRGHIEL